VNAQEAADILGVNRRRHGDLREMLRALTLYPWLIIPQKMKSAERPRVRQGKDKNFWSVRGRASRSGHCDPQVFENDEKRRPRRENRPFGPLARRAPLSLLHIGCGVAFAG
jgi:hypothetical protein